MPRYRVIARGFINGKIYDPHGKRSELITDKAFKKCPSWLQPVKEESAAQRKKREAIEAKTVKATEAKAEQDRKDVDSVTFTQLPSQSQVETL